MKYKIGSLSRVFEICELHINLGLIRRVRVPSGGGAKKKYTLRLKYGGAYGRSAVGLGILVKPNAR